VKTPTRILKKTALCGALLTAGSLWAFARQSPLASPTTRPSQATGLTSFEGREQPLRKYVPDSRSFQDEKYIAITDAGDGTVRMTLRYFPDWWDADRDKASKDRQRAEVKGLGPHQKTGQTFEYDTTWRTDPTFKGTGRFCHIFQLKATDGSDGPPLVTLSILSGVGNACVQYCTSKSGFHIARTFSWKPGDWTHVAIRIKTATDKTGEVLASVNGDPFKGVSDLAIYRPKSDDYRPKWGLYRGIDKDLPVGESWVEHKDISARQVQTNP